MVLKILVLMGAILQVLAASFLSIGTFDTTERTLQVFIQPAGWAFSIWGLIYLFSLVYAVYQLIPKYENRVLAATRWPAVIGFLSSIAWLYFAGSGDWQTWFTAPVLFLMAISFTFVVRAPERVDQWQTLLSKKLLYPYAAWTGIAAWLNVQTLVTDMGLVTGETLNIVTNLVLFVCVAAFTLFYLRKTSYSIFYGGVMIWAGIGVVYANLNGGMVLFAVLGGLLSLVTTALYIRNQ
jgi:hypothetical protein